MEARPEAPEPARSEGKDPSAARSTPPTRAHRGWRVRSTTGSAQRFHDLDPGSDTHHGIWIHRVDRPAAVFGSTQLPAGFQPRRDPVGADVEVCRRRSGGGLVVVRPGDVWIDAIVPRHSPLHTEDVGLAFQWFGQVWLEALRIHARRGDLDDRRFRLAEPVPGRRAADRPFFCFADVGHGEVLHGDRKIVGVSQRRTRHWTRLQALAVWSWDPVEIDNLVDAALGSLSTDARPRADLGAPPHQAAEVRAGFAPDHPAPDPDAVIDTVLQRLPTVAAAAPASGDANQRM